MAYKFREIESKWQAAWAERRTFAAADVSDKPKFYALSMFPYPSGAGLHVGHPLGYIGCDIIARLKRHQGYNVLHPMGYDSFGLPAEQYAIQTGQHPAVTTKANIERYREQLDQLGFSFDWSREVRTSSPDYYRWTQKIFSLLYESWYNLESDRAEPIDSLRAHLEAHGTEGLRAACDDDAPGFSAQEWASMDAATRAARLSDYRLTYLAETEVNWCPGLGTVLANDEIINGVSERGSHPVVRKKMKQWIMRISAYAERLLSGLEKLDWPEPVKEIQRNWFGRSVGASITFALDGHQDKVRVFTTRPDTLFGVTFMTLAPEHELVAKITSDQQRAEVEAYVEASARRSDRDRMTDTKSISGVFTGGYALHPFTGEKIPVWIGDYVLAGYGTGAVMAVPSGDQRDYLFAKRFELPIKNIFEGVDISNEAFTDKATTVLAHSSFLDGLDHEAATARVIAALEEAGKGKGKVNFRLRDAVFSRQRFWGEPFPVYYVDGEPRLIDDAYLPLLLPEVEKYLPTEDGAPPLGNASVWAWDTEQNAVVGNERIDHETVFPLELNTMPGWAGSSWYWCRYMDPQNSDAFASPEALEYWGQVDLYVGGSEHATGHLIYSRFWQHFLFDRGLVPVEEFSKKMVNQGMILGTSAFAYRRSGTNTFVSFELCTRQQSGEVIETETGARLDPIHMDVSLVNNADQLDTEGARAWQTHLADAEFVASGDHFAVGREVEKMSKSKYNVVNPDDICEQYGADTMRLYEMFLGPLELAKPWNTAGLTGVHGFLKKFWKLCHDGDGQLTVSDAKPIAENLKSLHKTLKKVNSDMEAFAFNTAVSAMMIGVNELGAQKCKARAIIEPLTVLLSPFAPHICEEVWEQLGHPESIETAPWPEHDEAHLVESTKSYPVSFNGKTRFLLELPLSADKAAIEAAVFADERTAARLDGKTPKKVIIVPGRIINIVV